MSGIITVFGKLIKGLSIKDLNQLDLFSQGKQEDIFTGKVIQKEGKSYVLKPSKKDPFKRRYMRVDEQMDMFKQKNAPEKADAQSHETKKKVAFGEQISLFDQQKKYTGDENKKQKTTRFGEETSLFKQSGKGPTANTQGKAKAEGNSESEQKTIEDKQTVADRNINQIIKGKKRRRDINQKVVELLEQKKDGEFTEEDKNLLRQYTGMGGLGGDVDNISLNEYYTLPMVTELMWDALKYLGFKGGRVLEPSCGVGNFLATAPHNTLVTGVEIDEVSGRIANILYGDNHDIRNQSFESFNSETDGGEFDAVIGNVPFGVRGATVSEDVEYRDLTTSEQYFLQRSIDDVKENGLVALIVPTGIMSNRSLYDFRKEINKQAEFLGAIRLPDGAFKHSNTSVTTDIVFFRKRPQVITEKLRKLNDEELDKVYDNLILDQDFISGSFFDRNPQYAIGEKKQGRYGDDVWVGSVSKDDILSRIKLLKNYTEDYKRLFPDVSVTATEEKELHVGDTKMINGRVYRLNENHRWERIRDEVNIDLPDSLKEKINVNSINELQELSTDISKLWNLSREELGYLDGKFVNKVNKELNQIGKPSDINDTLLIRSVMIGVLTKEYFRKIQTFEYNDTAEALRESEIIKNLLADYVSNYGNPHENKSLRKLVGATHLDPILMLLHSIDKEGNYHKIFDEPLSFYNVYKRSSGIGDYQRDDLYSVVQYLYNNGLPADKETISRYYKGNEDVKIALLNRDDIFIDENGYYAPIQEVCVGEVSSKIDAWTKRITQLESEIKQAKSEDERDLLELERKKLDKQIIELKQRAGWVGIEDLPVSLEDVKSGMFNIQYLNEYLVEKAPSIMISPLYYDPKTKCLLPTEETVAKGYFLYISGTGDKRDKAILRNILRIYFYDEQHPLYYLLLNKLNGVRIKARNEFVLDEIETLYKDLQSGFPSFLKQKDDIAAIEQRYNNYYNNYIHKVYSEEPIEGISKLDYDKVLEEKDGVDIRVRDKIGGHIWANVRRMYEQGKGMIAHGVGLGKTLQGILLALLHKQTGKAKKPLIIVPNSVLKNWVDEIHKWCKDIDLLVVGMHQDSNGNWVEDTREQKRSKLLNLANNDKGHDIILMSRDTFGMIDFTEESKKLLLKEITDNIMSTTSIEEYAQNMSNSSSKTFKSRERKENLIQSMMKLLSPTRTVKGRIVPDVYEDVYFENLGVDLMIRDEAHDAKNLFTSTENIVGLNAGNSQRALHNYLASKILRSKKKGQGVYSLTATPISNTPLEVYNMMLPFASDEMEHINVNNIDDFVRRFALIDKVASMDTDTKVKMKVKCVGWKNPQAIRNLFFRFVDYKTKDMVASANIKTPKEIQNHILTNLNEKQKELMKDCLMRVYCIKYRDINADGKMVFNNQKLGMDLQSGIITKEEADEIKKFYKEEFLRRHISKEENGKPKYDLYFRVQTDMMKIAADLDWYKDTRSEFAKDISEEEVKEYRQHEKYDKLIENALGIYKNGGKQLIFTVNTQIHDNIKQRLVAAGIPAREICIVNGQTAKDSLKRKQISDLYNEGVYKIIIGNYDTMGEGLNFNKMTTDIHHLQPTWNYLKIEQGNGRGIRQGNDLDTVNTHFYLAKGSIDGFMINKVFEKKDMVDKFIKGEIANWEDEVKLDGDEIIIALSSNPEQAARIKNARDKALQQALKESMMSKAIDTMKKYYEIRGRLKMKDPNTEEYKHLLSQAEKYKNDLVNNPDFLFKDYLELEEMPVIIKDKNMVFPISTVIQYGSPDTLVKIESYNPSTGRIVLKGYQIRYNKMVIPVSYTTTVSAISKLMEETGEGDYGVRKVEDNPEGLIRKIIFEVKPDNRSFYNDLPREIIDKYRDKIVDNIMQGNPYNIVAYKGSDGKIYIAEKKDIEGQNYTIVFPHDDIKFAEFLLSQSEGVAKKGENDEIPEEYSHIPHYLLSSYLYRLSEAYPSHIYLRRLINSIKGKTSYYNAYPHNGAKLILKLQQLRGKYPELIKHQDIRFYQSRKNEEDVFVHPQLSRNYANALYEELLESIGLSRDSLHNLSEEIKEKNIDINSLVDDISLRDKILFIRELSGGEFGDELLDLIDKHKGDDQ